MRDEPRTRAEREIDDELSFHRECTLAELRASGMDPHTAEVEARRRFGPDARHRRRLVNIEVRRQAGERRRAGMEVFTGSLRSVVRGVRRSPGFTLGIVAILTLGLGVNAITFGLVDRLILSGPAGVQRSGELRRIVVHRQSRGGAAVATTELGYLDYRDLLSAGQLAGAAGETSTPLLFGSGESAERIQARLVTASYFPLLGVEPEVGRFFTADESEKEGARMAVLSHAFWRRRFGADPEVIGRVMSFGSNRYTVVGVAPRYFTGSAVARVDVFLPLEAASDEVVEGPWRTGRNLRWMGAIVRLPAGASGGAVTAEITTRHRQAYADESAAGPPQTSGSETGKGEGPFPRLELAPLNAVRGTTAAGELGVAALVGGVALLVLLITIANVANLFLARSLRRRDQIAIRVALGGGRARLAAEQAFEGALLALAGGAVALVVAVLGARPVQTLLFPEVLWLDAPVNLRALLFIALCAITGGALAAALPMWQTGRSDTMVWLRTAGQRVSRTRTQGAMLLVQGALSVLLLVGAGLFVRSLARAQSLDLGLDTGRLLVVSALRGQTPPRPDFRTALRARIEKIPGVERTTLVAGTLPFVSSWAIRVNVPGLPERPRVDDGGPYVHAVEPGYFETVGSSIVEGRPFTREDREGAPLVTIVNRSIARLYWPGERAIGRCLQIGSDNPPCSTVVGVVENTRRQEIVEGESLLYYVPIQQAPPDLRNSGRLLIRAAETDTDTIARLSETIRREALVLEPGLRYVAARALDDVISPQLRSWRLGAGLFSVFGLLALVVAAVGLYSVVAFDVEGRRRELGVRAALGASSSAILRLVVGDGLRLAAGGVLLGLAAAWLLAPQLSGLLYGVPPQDATVFGGVAIVLVAAALMASAVPGFRAARIDPSRALRDQ
ncbi:MAG TPA: ABC transporter permease [Vicinamibacterales bacterium]|nr:ABC transporter permease [Vicinamibacterales bacterium]